MEFDDGHDGELGDDEPTPPLLPPDDRLWRHPSEIASVGLPEAATRGLRPGSGPGRGQPGRPQWGAFLSGSIGALLVIGTVTAVGGFRTREVPVRSVEKVALSELEASAPNARLTDPLVTVADRVQPSMVQVRAERPDGVLNASGFLFRSDGFVFTAQRVVEGARRVKVTLADASVRDALLVGTDPDTGLGVLKLSGARGTFSNAALGTAVTLRPGQTAIALGAPMWVGVGVVASVGRAVQSKDSPLLFDMIEINASVDPLASGGPLLDGRGAVVGVLDVLDGRGFATPIDIARDVADQLISTGRVEYGWLGVNGGDIDSAAAKRLGVAGGAVVGDVDDGSPAYLAGLHPGDVVVAVEGAPVATMAALKYAVRSFRPGRAVTLNVLRAGQPLSLNATLTERPARY
ncbi:MAG TPA: trypsin-like peptidase domain-containing protein [Acidimicrobiales bacterium]|nr:trypsin-like peptidase domain-containing protein [Acidimicrobiales bacterium]